MATFPELHSVHVGNDRKCRWKVTKVPSVAAQSSVIRMNLLAGEHPLESVCLDVPYEIFPMLFEPVGRQPFRVCPYCKKSFPISIGGKRTDALYCSPKCRMGGYRNRKESKK